jgi:beta-mannosidase
MKTVYDLSSLDWKLSGYVPYSWMMTRASNPIAEIGADFPAVAARVPGSVQDALRTAGILPDWNVGLNARQCEWVENRHWLYEADLPDEWFKTGRQVRLVCQGLDYSGWMWLNGQEVGRFEGTHMPHTFDLAPYIKPKGNHLMLIFDLPPRWLGQVGFTSQMTDWKPRFYYTWDWVSRLVQTGIWDSIVVEVSDGNEIRSLKCVSGVNPETGKGTLNIRGQISGGASDMVVARLESASVLVREESIPVVAFAIKGIAWEGLDVSLWWPNGQGEQPLYRLTCQLLDRRGITLDEKQRQVGFKWVEWHACEDAPLKADPWICTVNGRPVFLQGVNWTPIRPNFADVSTEDYRQRLELYRDLGINVLRVWGGAYLEKEIFYSLCDALGILVWQEFPLSSSGLENWPPEDEASIAALEEIAESYVARRQHHVSLLMWCGGNELQGGLDGSKTGGGKPVDETHPLIRRLAQVVAANDAGRRFVATSSSGPLFSAERKNFGQGLHWDVHGPWKADPDLNVWRSYWQDVDGLFHSEVGAPGASPVDIILRFKGDLPAVPGTEDNPLWRRTPWWIEWPLFVQEKRREPSSLEEYVAWSQERQSQALSIVARALKDKFPRCGGVIFWMGHDCFPCTANTAIIDYDGRPKPAALSLAKIFRSESQ